MSLEINVPKLGMSMSEGTLAKWLVADGSRVEPGTPIYILETDKVENEIESQVGGTIRLVAEEGETYDVGALLATVEDE